MKLEINEKEMGEILLAWANREVVMPEGQQFNHIDVDCSYSSIRKVTFSRSKEGESE